MAQAAIPEAPSGFGPSWRLISAPDTLANACVEQASYPTTPSSLAWGSSYADPDACQEVAWLLPVSTGDRQGLGQPQGPLAPASPLPQDLRAAGTTCLAQLGAFSGLGWDMDVSAPQINHQEQQLELGSLFQPLEAVSTSTPLQQQLLSLQLQGAGGIAGHLYDDAVQSLRDRNVAAAGASLEQQQQQQLMVLAADALCNTPTPLQLVRRRFSDSGSSVASSSQHSHWPLPMGSGPAPAASAAAASAAAAARGATSKEPLCSCGRSAPVLQVVVPNDCSGAPSPSTPQLVCLSDGTLLAVSQPALSSTQQQLHQQQQQGPMYAASSPTYIMLPPDVGTEQAGAPSVVMLPPGGALQGSWGHCGATLVTLAAPGAQPVSSSWQRSSPASRVSSASSSGGSDDSMGTTVLVCRDVSMAAALMQQQQGVQVAAPMTAQAFSGLGSSSGLVLAAVQPTSTSSTWAVDPPGLEGCGQPQQQQQPAAAKGSPAAQRSSRDQRPRSSSNKPPGPRLLRLGESPAAVLGGASWGELLVARGALVVLLETTWGVLTWTHFGAWAAAVRQLLTKGVKKSSGGGGAGSPLASARALLNHTTTWPAGGKGTSVEINSHQMLQLLQTWRSAIWTLTHAIPGSRTAVPDQACPDTHPQHLLCDSDGSMLFHSPWDVASSACPLALARTLNCYPPRHSRLGQPAPTSAGEGCLVDGLRWEGLPQCYKTTRLLGHPQARNVLPDLAGLMGAGALPQAPELLQASAAQWWALAEAARRQVKELGLV